MKQSGLLLLIIIFLTYGYKGYKVYDDYINDEIKIKESGLLSDISNNVTPVNLKVPHIGDVQEIRRVQKDGNNIFLLSGDKLLHFDINGNFINNIASDISDHKETFIADYTIDNDRHHVIIIDSSRNICRYNYNGELLYKAKISHPWSKLTAFTYHNGHLWATAESIEKHADDNSLWVVNNLYKLDMNMNEISREKLHLAEARHDILFQSLHAHELLVDEQGVYAYTPPVNMKYLLEDTLNILQRNSVPMMFRNDHYGKACLYPVRKSKHFMISTFYNTNDDHYTFCYDNSNNTAYMLQKGFKDDLFNTGHIADLQPVEIGRAHV